ncbi:ABC transporter [Nocardioides marmoriginsengisoli]|uniref:ABC transporter n=1 Tax=Nocardioides marmoriginsengisoli TaxID=661483 RepID=A0A3N0CIB4_9ACTN|nr:GTPase [Nocardioides marmoriginsengisoli]RNL63174.1 ABC transporter [Nocardioides marmoriginsengisoli]
MTSLLEGAKKLVTRGTDIGVRVKGLDAAVGAARGRLDDALLDPAAEVVTRASERLRLSADHTVVALGGATGSGKSSTFNALVGLDLASVGVRRPTTSWATACTWGTDGAGELLEWLGIPPRHQVVRDSMLDTGREAKDMNGLVLLDMPDHDSTEVSHHLEVDRLVRLADLLIWVLDPQKYADAAIHDGFLRPLAAHQGVMMVVLNHIDEVAEDRRDGMVADLRRLLDADGLQGITLIAVSAREGIGIDELRRAITKRVADKAATKARISTNLTEVTASLSAVSGTAPAPQVTDRDQVEVRDAIADAAGVPIVVDAVQRASLIRAQRATGWPVTSWLSRLRRDPLKKLNLDLGASGKDLLASARVALPDANQVQHARVDSAVRQLSDRLSADLSRPWATAVRRASTSRLAELDDRLDRAVGSTDLGVSRIPLWTRAVRGIQWLLLLAAVAGGLWLVALAAVDFLKLDVPSPELADIPVPTLLLAGGVGLGLLLSAACHALVSRSAKRRAHQADVRLRKAVDEVTEELVVGPLRVELDAYRTTVEGLKTARG